MSYVDNGYTRNGFSGDPYKKPFTTREQWVAEIGEGGTVTTVAASFIADAGGYATFTIAKLESGTYAASLDWDCSEIGNSNPVYVKGDGTLVIPSTTAVQDNNSYCP